MNMLRKILFTLVIVLFMGSMALGQNATIKGKVTETDGKTPIEFANVQLMQEGSLVMGAVTDEDGQYTLKPISAGKYDLIVTFTGYAKYNLTGLEVHGSEIKIQDVTMSSSAIVKGEVKVVAERPLFSKDQTVTEDRVTSEEMNNMAGKSVSNVLSTMAGVTVSSGGGMNVRGNRDGQTAYYVDGVKTSSVPQGAIGEMALLMGALPAKYGDATSVVEIETKGPSREHHGNVEATGSIDGYNSFGLQFDFSGPIGKQKEGATKVGYLISGEAGYSTGGAVRGGSYRASQETIDYLIHNPLRAADASSSAAVAMNANYVTFYQEGEILSLEEKRAHRLQNSWSYSGQLAGKIDIRTPKNIDLMFTGNVSYGRGRSYNFSNSLFNSANNGMSNSLSWNVNARFTQRFNSNKDAKIQNAFYRLQAYYIQSNSHSYSHIHKDNLFDYGYIGKFEHTMSKYYQDNQEVELENGEIISTNALSTYYISDVKFTPGSQNYALAQYTLGAYERAGGTIVNDEYLQRFKGLRNGDYPGSAAYGLFTAPGIPYNGNGYSSSDRIGAKAMVSFDIKGKEGKDHNIEFGFEYIQTTSRSYSISPVGLWTLMRQYANSHIQELDKNNPIFYYDENGQMIDTVDYKRLVSVDAQSTFDKNIRAKLGAAEDEWIDIDAYDPSTYSLDMFSAEELFNGGNNIVSYYGYNYTGNKKINKAITMSDMQNWFNESDKSSKRDFSVIGASKPIRMAAYIQDKFAIKSLYFSLGLRLDIFDNNQPYVKDLFLYRESYTVKEAQNAGLISKETYVPDFISGSDDYYVYVQDAASQDVTITAYRKGLTWYDADGNEVTDAATLAAAAGQPNLLPLLKDLPGASDVTKVNYKAFADYTPTFSNGGITLSPRISFSFVVGESSVFSASYNIVTNTASQRLNPLSYLYFEKYAGASSTFANPGLKPERSIDYEVGFQQGITKDLKVEFKAYYSEKRDQVVVYHYNQAYPQSYYSYTNMDFGTTQGFLFGLTMRRVKNVSFRASYTLQFAKGTGSDASSTLALIRSGQPNLRTLTTLDYDQRHKINFNFEYSFGFGNDYNGPRSTKALENGRSREINWLQGAGLSLQLGVGSGLPYTRSSVAYSTIVNQGSRSVEGAINGSRMPWVVDCNMKIWKDFIFTIKKDEDIRKQKSGYLRVYVSMMNLFNIKKVRSVYSYTGSPIDDGFLTANDFQQYIAAQENVQSFTDYYRIRVQGINAYGSPMTAELGVAFSF